MGSDGTSSGSQSGGTDSSRGSGDTEEHSQDQLIRRKVMSGIFVTSIIFSAVIGIAAGKFEWYITVPICIFGGLVSMFFGMGIEWIRYRNEIEDIRGKLALERMTGEMRCRRRIQQVEENSRKECSGFAVESVRAVANRVANRMVAKYAGGLLLAEQREATLADTDQIVDEEVNAFHEAVKDESEGD
jgi:hypothetical protein